MGVLLMLMTICGLIAGFVLLSISYFTKKLWLRNFVMISVGIWFAFYAILLFGSSLMSKEKTLALNEPKEFCGFYFDCHLQTAVSGVRKTKMIGNRTATGEFYVVKVKVFSDAKRASLGLSAVDAKVVDSTGKLFARDANAEAGLGDQPPFEQRITPTESFEKEIVFDLPAEITAPRLDLRDGYGIDIVIEAVLVDDEDSILHKRNFFKLETDDRFAETPASP